MNIDSRIKNTKRNIVSGTVKQLTSIILPFIIRTIIIYSLGAQYQGISGLFTSILQVLNLAESGFTTAVVYVLYKPIADNDNKSVRIIIGYLKRVYSRIGYIIFAVGLIVTPALKLLIAGECPGDLNIYIIFIIYLFNTAISYLLYSYKSALFTALQRADVVDNIYTVTSALTKIAQIAVLLAFKNYYVYVIMLPIGTILNNILLQTFSKKYYPDIEPSNDELPTETKNTLFKQIKAVFINKVGDVARNSFDNIILSSMLGLTIVAIYDNYYYIFSALYNVALMITHAMQASVGNSIAKEPIEKNHDDLLKFSFIYSWVTGWMSICMCCIFQPFMLIWMKGDSSLLLSNFNMTLICIYFYLINMNNTRNLYLNGYGLFWECRWLYIAEAIANLVLNIILGKFMGITGIMLATIITIFIFNFVMRTQVLYKNYFKKQSKVFYTMHAFWFLTTAINTMITGFICEAVQLEGFLELVVRAIICVVVPNLIYLVIYCRTKQFKESFIFVRRILLKRD